MIQATDGNFYGTTAYGGNPNCYLDTGCGTVFKITAGGTMSTLHSFCSQAGCTDGEYPYAGLIQATDGNFYGTTNLGGRFSGSGICFYGCGTAFKITPDTTLTTVYTFCSLTNCADGAQPWAGLIQATDGNLYGTAEYGGVYDGGTIFKIAPSGTLTTLYNFCSQSNCTDGMYPLASVVQNTNGRFYGTTLWGGAYDTGTAFVLSTGLPPFVEMQPNHGKAGRVIKILGTNLGGASSVTFNGTPAVFKVVSNSLIGAVVPAGATTGTVQVTTPSGVLSSNVPFTVMQ